jgi:catechol 2,3-dioxygenase-like lactoylglutathione lyase family enzyme
MTITGLHHVLLTVRDLERSTVFYTEVLGCVSLTYPGMWARRPGYAHLACLRHCRLVSTERRGTQVEYTLALPDVAALMPRARGVAAPESEHLASCSRVGPD